MAYEAKILADSISHHGHRLTTLEVVFPRFILAEFNTHRMLSRNTASSRAIPVEKQLIRVLDNPYVPDYWGVNQPGMQAETRLEDPREISEAEKEWLSRRDMAVLGAVALTGGIQLLKDPVLQERILLLQEHYGESSRRALPKPIHKQLANRLLEPFMWHTAIVTATEWTNFEALRAHPDAQPEIRRPAELMMQARQAAEPQELEPTEWHLPLIHPEDRQLAHETYPKQDVMDVLKKIAVGRCARVSYLTHDGIRDLEKDIELQGQLKSDGHMSPFEHVARPMTDEELLTSPWLGNFRGWHQYRKDIPHEANFAETLAAQDSN